MNFLEFFFLVFNYFFYSAVNYLVVPLPYLRASFLFSVLAF
jgi:hypothetical protein